MIKSLLKILPFTFKQTCHLFYGLFKQYEDLSKKAYKGVDYILWIISRCDI